MANCEILTKFGTTGSGKTYSTVVDLVQTGLPNTTYRYITNLPIEVEAMKKHFGNTNNKRLQDLESRFYFLTEEVLLTWKNEESGPWDLPREILANSTIILDEAQHFVGPTKSDHYLEKWKLFLGEVRHEKLAIEFMTQFEESIHKHMAKAAGQAWYFTDGRVEKDPWFGIEFGDWHQVNMSWFGLNRVPFVVHFKGERAGYKVKKGKRFYVRNGAYFKLYDSYCPPLFSGIKHEKRAPKPTVKLTLKRWLTLMIFGQVPEQNDNARDELWNMNTRFEVLWWFIKKHWFNLIWSQTAFLIALVLYVAFGLWPTIQWFQETMQEVLVRNNAKKVAQQQPTSEVIDPQKPTITQPQPTPAALVESPFVKDLQEQNEALRLRVEEQATKEAENALRLLTPDYAVFGAKRIFRGMRVDTGPFQGRTLQDIDYDSREVLFSDGTIVGVLPGVRHKQTFDPSTLTKAAGRAAQSGRNDRRSQTPGIPDNDGNRKSDDVFSDANAAAGLRPSPDRPVQNIGGRVRRVGSDLGYNRPPTSLPPGSSISPGPTP